MKCPKCNEALSGEAIADLSKDSEFTLALTPTSGHRMQAVTVGKVLSNADRLFVASGKALGLKTTLLVKEIQTTESGEIRATLIVARTVTAARTPALAEKGEKL